MQPKRGAIRSLEHYARGKLIDSSSWGLPRGITPSDVDLVFDNDGKILVCEISGKTDRWEELDAGQRWLYESLCRLGCKAALLKHSVPMPQIIDSRNDIDSYSLMKCVGGEIQVSEPRHGASWPEFVEEFWFGQKKVAA